MLSNSSSMWLYAVYLSIYTILKYIGIYEFKLYNIQFGATHNNQQICIQFFGQHDNLLFIL